MLLIIKSMNATWAECQDLLRLRAVNLLISLGYIYVSNSTWWELRVINVFQFLISAVLPSPLSAYLMILRLASPTCLLSVWGGNILYLVSCISILSDTEKDKNQDSLQTVKFTWRAVNKSSLTRQLRTAIGSFDTSWQPALQSYKSSHHSLQRKSLVMGQKTNWKLIS